MPQPQSQSQSLNGQEVPQQQQQQPTLIQTHQVQGWTQSQPTLNLLLLFVVAATAAHSNASVPNE